MPLKKGIHSKPLRISSQRSMLLSKPFPYRRVSNKSPLNSSCPKGISGDQIDTIAAHSKFGRPNRHNSSRSGGRCVQGHRWICTKICNIAIWRGKKRFFIGVSIFPVTSSYLMTYKKNPESFGSLRKKLQIFKVRTFWEKTDLFFSNFFRDFEIFLIGKSQNP